MIYKPEGGKVLVEGVQESRREKESGKQRVTDPRGGTIPAFVVSKKCFRLKIAECSGKGGQICVVGERGRGIKN